MITIPRYITVKDNGRGEEAMVQLLVHVQVKPNSREYTIFSASRGINCALSEDDSIVGVALKARAHDNAANEDIIGYFSEIFSIKQSHIKIVSGKKSKEKIIQLTIITGLRLAHYLCPIYTESSFHAVDRWVSVFPCFAPLALCLERNNKLWESPVPPQPP